VPVSGELVQHWFEGPLARIRLTRGASANTIDLRFGPELTAAVDASAAGGARAVLLDAEGPIFCGGGDMKHFGPYAVAGEGLGTELHRVASALHVAELALWDLDVPVVACVQGPVAGAGIGLMCCADLVVASTSARFVLAYTRIALSPDGGSSYFLPRMIGLRRALELTLTNRTLSAEEALEWGLVSSVVPDDEARSTATRIAVALADGATGALGRSKRLLRESERHDLSTHLGLEADSLRVSGDSSEGLSGVAAFATRGKQSARPGSGV
jgi:2-(1,2-epoxy-1,2-dihydrophenyl)acetyl-CoA isomerase